MNPRAPEHSGGELGLGKTELSIQNVLLLAVVNSEEILNPGNDFSTGNMIFISKTQSYNHQEIFSVLKT